MSERKPLFGPRYGSYSPPKWDDIVGLYTMRDLAGFIIYIGISKSPLDRFRGHASESPWWPFVRRIDIDYFADREEALDAEAAAIHEHQPPFNIDHTDRGGCRDRRRTCPHHLGGPADAARRELAKVKVKELVEASAPRMDHLGRLGGIDGIAARMVALGITPSTSGRDMERICHTHGLRYRHAILVAAWKHLKRPEPVEGAS